MRSYSFCSFHCFLKKSSGICEFQFWNWGKNIWILKIWSLWPFFSIFIFNFSINSSFRLIIYPFTNEKFVFITIEIRALTFSFIIHPMALKVIAISFCQNPVPISFSFMPLAFIYVSIIINHSSFTLRHSIYPVSIVSVTVFKEKSSSSMFFIFKPISSVLSS